MTNYPIAAEALDLEIYYLSCLVASSRKLVKLSKSYGSIKSLVNTFELSEVSKKLISIAVTLRSSLDCCTPESKSGLISKTKIGTLIKDTEKFIEQPLDFREACNKIIHATDVDFFDNCLPDDGLSWFFTLFGEFHKKKWKASLDVLKFIDVANKLT